MILDNAVYRRDTRVAHDLDPADLVGVGRLREPGDFQWVSLRDPSRAEMDLVSEAFSLHPLLVDNALDAHQRPKVERHGDMVLLVLKTLWYVEAEDAAETGELTLLVGADYVVTVRHGGGSELAAAHGDLDHRARARAHGPLAVVYAVCDQVVDDYEKVVTAIEEDVDEVEASVFSDTKTDDSMRIYTLKRELAEVRRAVFPLREPLRRLAAGQVFAPGPAQTDGSRPGGLASPDAETARYLRDVSDHLQRVSEAVDTLDLLLSAAFDAHVARLSLRQNDDMRKISAGAALVVVPTLVAGIYGMNFRHMPELEWTYGYAFSLALMIGIVVGLYAWFRRSGWL